MSGMSLDIQGLEKRYGRVQALRGLDMHVPENATCAFIGANGAGKTTTFSLVGDFLRPNSGTIRVSEMPIREYRRKGGAIGLLPQDMHYFEDRTLLRQLQLFAELSGWSKKEAREEAMRVLELVDLADRAKNVAEELSRGMRVRLGVAQAFVASPPLVLLDEPMAGLDPKMRVLFRSAIEKVKGETTLIISSHELGELQTLCDYVCMIDKGQLVRQCPMEELLQQSARVEYVVQTMCVPLEELEKKLPEVEFSLQDDNHLIANFDDSKVPVDKVNAVVLEWLLEKGVGIFEVNHRRSLEEVFLQETAKGKE